MTAIAHAMVLAAGRGVRMRPITDRIPKPLAPVHGSTLLDHALDRLTAAGVENAVVNLHYLGRMIEEHLKGRTRPAIRFSREVDLLDTGGGVANALGLLGGDPFYVVNSDALWIDSGDPALHRLAAVWDASTMDALLLLHPVADAQGYDGPGDYARAADGRLTARSGAHAPFVFTGVQILSPRLFTGVAVEPFSLKRLYDRAENAGRLHGLVHDGRWFHIGTPDALAAVNAVLAQEP